MAQTVVIGNQTFKRRSPVGVWLGLPLITGGIYTLVWYYKINNEAKRYLGDASIKPGVSLLAILFGWLLIVPPFISMAHTAGRIQRMQRQAGVPENELINPTIAVVLMFFFSLYSLYMQSHLNKIWDRQPAMVPAPALAVS